ncbi:acyl-homoserine-lactone synthase [Palleronia abyssalis]|uniref:Acyl-homoserine-lactone synthase n=1 Tax=Palleronia abyssalis TaxID=1501240 RepID=A0A2R8BXN3_9RHOB|nr:acyl-homoserine-lactone synthase [Palleronia abyssalis]SPJ24915.1 Acyl-homoserine-lactone synthase [Palleronia abyssalis]
MIIIVDALNRHKYTTLVDRMFQLRAQVFGGRLGWDVQVENGREIDQYDSLDPAYVIGVNAAGDVVSCVRALQTTGPHMLSDVFSAILGDEPPLRSPTLWESTRFCVDTKRLARGRGPGSISDATAELMIGSLEYAMSSGIDDIVTVIDPVMDKVLKRSNNAPYDYVGSTVQMGKVPALAALLDCTQERIDRVRDFANIPHDVFAGPEELARFTDAGLLSQSNSVGRELTVDYLWAQFDAAKTVDEVAAVYRMWMDLFSKGLVESAPPESLTSRHVA